MTQLVELAEGRLEVLDIPAREPAAGALLLLHEGLGSVSTWRDFPYQLAATTGARIVAYSRFGFGKSSPRPRPWSSRFMDEEAKEWLPALRQALGLVRPVIVGHSTGGSMALLHASFDPAGVAGVVALAPLVDVEEGNLRSIREARDIFETTGWREKLARHHAHPIEQVFSGWNETWLDPSFRDWSIVADLAAIRAPVLAIVGTDDPYSSFRQLELIRDGATHAAGVSLVRLPDCGHVPHRDQPAAVLAAIASFAGLRGGAGDLPPPG